MTGRLHVRALRECEPRRICVVKPSALGDVVQSLPALAGLRARWPDASISWIIRDDLSDLIDGHPLIDEWIPFDRRGGVRAFLHLLRGLRSRRFDLVFDLQGLARSALMTAATGAPIRVGLQTSRDAASLTHNLILPHSGRDVSASVRYGRVVDAIGAGGVIHPAVIPLTEEARARARERLSSLARPVMAVHPGATWNSKRWPVGRFAAVASRAVRKFRLSVVVVAGPEEPDIARRFTDSLSAAMPHAASLNLAGGTSLRELAAVLESVDLLLTNDSGPMHLAAAVGTPVVGVFTSTSPRLSGPLLDIEGRGPRHQLVATPTACSGCYRRRCPWDGVRRNACHRDLSVDRVWQAVVSCLHQNRLVSGSSITPPAEWAQSPLPTV